MENNNINTSELEKLKAEIEQLKAERDQSKREVDAILKGIDLACIVSHTDKKGFITYVSSDKLIDEKTGQSFLEARADFKDPNDVAKLKLRTSLPAHVLLNTGPRSLISYILRPFKDRLAMGLQ